MKTWLRLAALALLPGVASASVPPSDWRPTVYRGPGVLCGDSFNLQLEAGETATVGFASEGYVPTTVRSHGGSFGVVSHYFNAPVVEKQRLAQIEGGDVYLVTRVVTDFASGVGRRRVYMFEPASKASVPFGLYFYAAVSAPGGWAEFPEAEYPGVIGRLSFPSRTADVQCLQPRPAK